MDRVKHKEKWGGPEKEGEREKGGGRERDNIYCYLTTLSNLSKARTVTQNNPEIADISVAQQHIYLVHRS